MARSSRTCAPCPTRARAMARARAPSTPPRCACSTLGNLDPSPSRGGKGPIADGGERRFTITFTKYNCKVHGTPGISNRPGRRAVSLFVFSKWRNQNPGSQLPRHFKRAKRGPLPMCTDSVLLLAACRTPATPRGFSHPHPHTSSQHPSRGISQPEFRPGRTRPARPTRARTKSPPRNPLHAQLP